MIDSPREVDVVVIGAGQAGLSSAYFLRKAGLSPGDDFVVFDHSDGPGGAWQYRWPSLTFETVHGIHQLPGMSVPTPPASASVAPVVAEYFGTYEAQFDLAVRRPVSVTSVADRPDHRLTVTTSAGTWITRAVINATGTWDKPFLPYYPGQEVFSGRQLHTVDYDGKASFAGERVLVVGGGASGIQLLLEIATVADTFWVTRREPEFVDRPFDIEWGREVIARVEDRVRRGLPPESVVKSTGYRLTPEIAAAREAGVLRRRPMFTRMDATGVSWPDGSRLDVDTILWATGFRAALDHLAPLRLRGHGGGITMDGTRVAADPRIHLVGYGPSASTIGTNRAGRTAVRELKRYLDASSPLPQPVTV